MNLLEIFPRTTCACEGCKACCKSMPGMLAPGDAERIMALPEHQDLDAEDLFAASDGALVVKDGVRIRIPTIVPRQQSDGRCVFLSANDLCQIHAVAPFGCAAFDVHMSKEDGDLRASVVLQAIHRDPPFVPSHGIEYRKLHEYLRNSGSIAPPVAERREKLERMLHG